MMRLRTPLVWFFAVLLPLGCASGGGDPPGPGVDSGVVHADAAGDGDTLDADTMDGDTMDGDTLDGDTLDGDTLDGDTLGRCLGVDCSGLDDVCVVGVCDPSDGSCALRALPDATVCDDGDLCTTGDACGSGRCAGTALDCGASGDACNVGVCDPTTGSCAAMPMGDGSACDDGDACTTGTTCSGGSCAGSTPVDCSSMADACHSASCDPVTGCMATPVSDGTSCDDSDACTSTDVCTSGTCAGSAMDCSGLSDACNAGVCDASTGNCVRMNVAAGTACDDGNACTSSDICGAGACTGTPITTGACAMATLTFPSSGDTRVAAASLYFWRLGDYVEGTRSASLSSASSADINLQIESNGLSCDTQDVQFRINGTTVGSFSIAGGDTSIVRSFSFPAIAGPNYVLRYYTVRAVGSGCGAAGYTNDVSTVTLHR